MEIVIASIPHTGTHFFINLFKGAGYGGPRRHGEPLPGVTDAFYTGHILEPGDIDAALRLGETRPIVSPMRHPFLVEETWKRRGPRYMPDLAKGFRTLVERFSHAYVIPLDSPARDGQMERFCRDTGFEFSGDWSIVHSLQKTAYMNPDDMEPSPEIREVMEWDLFRRFYGEANETKAGAHIPEK